MKEKIYTIPINESFEERSGCPVCRLYEKSRERALEYITGAAMMEPSVRIMTNAKGFCREHFAEMMQSKPRLSVALMLESHMDEAERRIFAAAKGISGGFDGEKAAASAKRAVESCFVCSRAEEEMGHYFSNIVHMWKSAPEFQRLYAEQEGFCLPHFSALIEAGKKGLSKKDFSDFANTTVKLTHALHRKLRGELADFTKSFDYRYANEPQSQRVKSSIENTALYLSSVKK